MQLHWSLAAILLAQGFYCYGNVPTYLAPLTLSQSRQQNPKQKDWETIISLTDRAYAEYAGNDEQGRRLFAEAADKLEAYIRRYETNPARLSYLRVLVRLGALYQNADNLDQARIVFEQCERHKAFNSPAATLRVGDVEQSIANYVKAQLCFLTNCSNPTYKEAYELVRIQGSSRGDDLAPQFSIPNQKRHQRKSRHSPA